MNYSSKIYIVNKLITNRFKKHLNCINKSIVIFDNDSLSIKIYNQIRIIIIIFKEKEVITFTNVCYVSNFIINVIANSILIDKELYFDIQYNYLYRNETSVVLVLRIREHYVLEDNSKEIVVSFAIIIVASRCRSRITLDWY